MFISTLHGFLIKDAKVSPTKSGDKLVNITVSVISNNPKNRGTKPAVRDLVNVSYFGKQSSTLDTYLQKGQQVVVTGNTYIDEYNGKSYLKVQADAKNLTLVGSNKSQDDQQTNSTPATTEQNDGNGDW